MSKANVKTNSMESTEWTYLKERSFVTNYFLFFGNLIQVQEPHINSRFNGPITQMSTCILFLSARVLFEALYSLRVSLRIPACVAHSSFLLQLGDGEYKVWVHIFRQFLLFTLNMFQFSCTLSKLLEKCDLLIRGGRKICLIH